MAVVQRPVLGAVASRCCRRKFQQLSCACGTKSRRGAQADARGATQVLDRGEQAVARGAARCLLYVLGRSAKTDARGRSFAVLPTKEGFNSWLAPAAQQATCGITLEVSRDNFAAGEEQLVSCAAEQRKYCLICTVAR
jgi:hypothetical protein